jgi:hypothetical protein
VATSSAGAPFSVAVVWSAASGANSYELVRTPAFASAVTTTATSYADGAVVAGVSYIYKVRAVRTSSCSTQYSPFSNVDPATTLAFTPITLTPPTAIAASHFVELRNAVNALRSTAGLAAATWSTGLASNSAIRAVYLTELRTALDSARAQLGLLAITYGEAITQNTTTIRKSHIDEIRGGVQ